MASGIKPHNLHAGFFSFKTIISFPLLPQCLRTERVKAKIWNVPKSTVPLDMQQESPPLLQRCYLQATVINGCFITCKENSFLWDISFWLCVYFTDRHSHYSCQTLSSYCWSYFLTSCHLIYNQITLRISKLQITEQIPGRATSHVNSSLVNNQGAGSVFEMDQNTRSQCWLLECTCCGTLGQATGDLKHT